MILSKLSLNRTSITGLVTASVVFPLTFNPRIINPLNYGWLWSGGDISSSFSGWNYFRHTPFFQWPLSDNPLYGGNIAQSVMFTDTPPLFAIPFKLLGLLTDEVFQFTGFQIALSLFLLIYFSQKILELFNFDTKTKIFGSILISQAPFFLFRNQFEHYSLNLMWVAIASLYLYLNERTNSQPAKSSVRWWLLVFIALTWMPYLTIYVFIFLIPWLLEKLKNQDTRQSRLEFLINQTKYFFFVLILGLTIDGYWGHVGRSGADGFGYYNANLLSFINSNSGGTQNWSRIIPGFESASEGQYEGFAYLGSGIIILFLLNFSLKTRISIKLFLQNSKKYKALTISCCFFILWATAGNFTFGDKTIVQITVPEMVVRYISVFRSTGRFMIPIAFLLTFFAIIITFRNFGNKYAAILFVGTILLTAFDQYPNTQLIREKQAKSNTLTPDQRAIRNVLIKENIKSVIFITPEMSAYIWKMNIIGQASLLGIPVNDGFMARINQEKLAENVIASRNAILDDDLIPNFLYVLYPSFIEGHREEVKILKE